MKMSSTGGLQPASTQQKLHGAVDEEHQQDVCHHHGQDNVAELKQKHQLQKYFSGYWNIFAVTEIAVIEIS